MPTLVARPALCICGPDSVWLSGVWVTQPWCVHYGHRLRLIRFIQCPPVSNANAEFTQAGDLGSDGDVGQKLGVRGDAKYLSSRTQGNNIARQESDFLTHKCKCLAKTMEVMAGLCCHLANIVNRNLHLPITQGIKIFCGC